MALRPKRNCRHSRIISRAIPAAELTFDTPDSYVAPLAPTSRAACWEGPLEKPPWQWKVSCCIPHCNTPELLPACIGLLRLQTVAPYIMLIDTGSSREVCEYLETLRAPDLEVHYVRGHGYLHSSEAVCVAQDLAFALARTDYLYTTHCDVFLRRRDYIEWLLSLCGHPPLAPVVGYQMSPRDWLTDEWQGCVSHTASLWHVPTYHRLGLSWSLERAHRVFGCSRTRGGWPDTEVTPNLIMRAAGVKPLLIGKEENYTLFEDSNLTHLRSLPGSKVLGNSHYAKAAQWVPDALAEADERIARWEGEDSLLKR